MFSVGDEAAKKYLTLFYGLGNLFIAMKLTAFIIALLVLSFPQLTFAEEGSSSLSVTPKKDRMEQLEKKKDALMERKDMKFDALEEKKEAFKQKKEAFKGKLAEVIDQKKAEIAQKLDEKLAEINKNRTERLLEKVTNLSEILSRLEAKKIEAQTNGKDVNSVNAAIVAAETAIANAETAIAAQAAKDYTAQVTDETTLRANFGQVVSQLRADLQATNKTVVDAKEAVKAAAKTLRLVAGVKELSPIPVVTAVPTI
jgi:hypothetical protein